MDELQKRGGKLLYDPELIIHRHPRPTFKAFCKMLLNYGRGRAEQFRLHPTPGSALNFVPPLFCVFLLVLPVLPAIFRWVLVAYAAAALAQAIALLPLKRILWLPQIMGLIFISHVAYGIGFWRGCLTNPRPPAQAVVSEIKLEKV